MTRPCFAVDIDNVLAKAEPEVQRIYGDLTGSPWPLGVYGSAGGLDSAQLPKDIVEEIFSQFHEHSIPRLSLLPGARLALTRLQRRYKIAIITARRPTSRPQTVAWLQRHRIPFEELYLTEEKADVAENIVLAVDDHPVHALAYCEAGVRVFLMNQPWNQGVSHPLLTRVSGWDELLQIHDFGDRPLGKPHPLELASIKYLLNPRNLCVPQPTAEAS
ncbi:MAG: hypothetical protein MRJ96_10160 [Nitrospirales bacterium]|nr:hypothetical protein [Nitrospira sp.]MDR4501801.1 hypothetical protein [Nitrospirales bacterium]